MYYTDNIVFGKDLIHAVELEEGHSMPSIIIDFNLISNKKTELYEEVDLFAVHSNKLDYDDFIKGIEKYIEELNKYYVDFKIIEKVKWLIEKLNLYFDKDYNIRYKIIYDNKYRFEKEDL